MLIIFNVNRNTINIKNKKYMYAKNALHFPLISSSACVFSYGDGQIREVTLTLRYMRYVTYLNFLHRIRQQLDYHLHSVFMHFESIR